MREKAEIDQAVFNGIRKTINRFREQPFLYFTESDIHASLSKDIMEGNSDILILGNTQEGRKTIPTSISLVHHEYPTNFRYQKDKLHLGYSDQEIEETHITKKHGDRGNYDLAILNPDFVKGLFEENNGKSLIEILENIINKNKVHATIRAQSDELLYAIEVKFIHLFNARNIQMLREVESDNEKLRLAIYNKHCKKAINLVFCSSREMLRRDDEEPVISQIKSYIQKYPSDPNPRIMSDRILPIMIESFIDPNNSNKNTCKPTIPEKHQGWEELLSMLRLV